MRADRFSTLFLAVAATGALGVACGNSGTSGTTGATSSASASSSGAGGSTSATSTSGATASSSAGGTGSSSSSGTGGAPAVGHCQKGCTVAKDCCPPNSPNCPGPTYPLNYACDKGLCNPPKCSTKADCTGAPGGSPGDECSPVKGSPQCISPCLADADCGPVAKCIGVDDAMTKFCTVPTNMNGCTTNADCGGAGVCKAGACVCDSNADCTSPYADTCVK